MGCCSSVPNDEIAIVENCGRFSYVAHPGILCIPWPVLYNAGLMSTRIMQMNVPVETKTRDNVFVELTVSVNYCIKQDKVYEAFYKLEDPVKQIKSYVFDVVRSAVPLQNLDEVFESKDDVAKEVKEQLKNSMDSFGYCIVKTLITDIVPDSKVQEAMNEINASKRYRISIQEKAEAEKLLAVKVAEADAEAKFLQGVGIAKQRKAVLDGLKASVDGFSSSIQGVKSKDVLDLVLITQYFDTLKDLGANTGSRTVFIPHNPGSLSAMAEEIRAGIMK